MNYPSVMTNPLLKPRESQKEREKQKDEMKFNNMERPITGTENIKGFKRPFSTKDGGETLMHKRKQLQFRAMAKDPSVD